jgi:hypothetical protein
MNATMLNTLLITTAVATPVWMIWRKIKGRPFIARWLFTVGALLLPIILAKFLAPAAWMDIRTMPTPFWFLTGLPFLLGVSALGGGLIVFIGKILNSFFNRLDAVKFEFLGKPKHDDDQYLGVAKAYDPFDFYNDWTYRFYRDDD